MNREGPIWLYIPCLLAGTLPWSLLVLAGWRRSLRLRDAAGRIDPALLYLVLWIAVPLVMFSLAHSKRPQYSLPLRPAVALLAAKVWMDAHPADAEAAGTVRRRPLELPGRLAAAVTWLTLGALCAAAAPVLARSHAAALAHANRLPPTPSSPPPPPSWPARRFSTRPAAAASPPAPAGPGPGAPCWSSDWSCRSWPSPRMALPLLGEIGRHRSSRTPPPPPSPPSSLPAPRWSASTPIRRRCRSTSAAPSCWPARTAAELTSNYVIAYFQKWGF